MHPLLLYNKRHGAIICSRYLNLPLNTVSALLPPVSPPSFSLSSCPPVASQSHPVNSSHVLFTHAATTCPAPPLLCLSFAIASTHPTSRRHPSYSSHRPSPRSHSLRYTTFDTRPSTHDPRHNSLPSPTQHPRHSSYRPDTTHTALVT